MERRRRFLGVKSLFSGVWGPPPRKGLDLIIKVVRDPCQKITLLLLKSKNVRVIVPESCF